MAAAAAAAFAGGGGERRSGGKRGLWRSGAGAVVSLLFLAAKLSWKFYVGMVWLYFLCEKMVFDSDVSDLAPEILPR
jgi:hypothetical protein